MFILISYTTLLSQRNNNAQAWTCLFKIMILSRKKNLKKMSTGNSQVELEVEEEEEEGVKWGSLIYKLLQIKLKEDNAAKKIYLHIAVYLN